MNPQGIDGVIKMSNKKDFKPFIQKAAKKGLGESVNEGRAFVAAAKKAKEEGKTEFEFNGKTYPVTIKEVLRKRNRKLR